MDFLPLKLTPDIIAMQSILPHPPSSIQHSHERAGLDIRHILIMVDLAADTDQGMMMARESGRGAGIYNENEMVREGEIATIGKYLMDERG